MGGFVLTNDKEKKTHTEILATFERKGMTNSTVIELGTYQLFYFAKINLPNGNHIFTKGPDRIIGIGTFSYEGRFGYSALASLYNDLTSEQPTESILNRIKGHFNLILYLDSELIVVADRVGAFHSFIARDEENIYVSNSFYAVAGNLSHLSVRKQELMEFIITEAIYGPDTLFEEVKYLEFGKMHRFTENGEVISSQYHEELTVVDGYNLEDHYEAIVKYMAFLKDIDLNISPDLTAGYDSRQVCAILKYLEVKHTPNTNYNSWDTTDLGIAEAIARGEGLPLAVYEKDLAKIPYDELLNNSISRTELYRDIFQAAYSYVFFDEKTKDFDIILGGYGGELYRDTKYHGIDSIDSLIAAKYLLPGMSRFFSSDEIQQFKDNLAEKMRMVVGHDGSTLSKVDCEKIYYFLRMMYWGGSRITYFNYYGYRYHPLLDYELIYPLFQIGDDQKHDGKFQMQIIERFNREMASHQSNYGHNFIWEEAKHHISRPRFHTKVLRFAGRKMRRALFGGKSANAGTTSWQAEEDRTIWQNIVGERLAINRYIDAPRIKGDEVNLGRLYSIEVVLQKYESKIQDQL